MEKVLSGNLLSHTRYVCSHNMMSNELIISFQEISHIRAAMGKKDFQKRVVTCSLSYEGKKISLDSEETL